MFEFKVLAMLDEELQGIKNAYAAAVPAATGCKSVVPLADRLKTQYGPQIKEYGYDQLKALLVATEEDIAEMTADPDAKMKKPHRRLFVAEWKELLASRP